MARKRSKRSAACGVVRFERVEARDGHFSTTNALGVRSGELREPKFRALHEV
jgi:hypothetical protein